MKIKIEFARQLNCLGDLDGCDRNMIASFRYFENGRRHYAIGVFVLAQLHQ